jgi:hypothetical protein
MTVMQKKSFFPSEETKPPRRITVDNKKARRPEPFTASETSARACAYARAYSYARAWSYGA